MQVTFQIAKEKQREMAKGLKVDPKSISRRPFRRRKTTQKGELIIE